MSEKLIITVDTSLYGNLSECSVCGKRILPDEDCFDYEYWGHNEIVHNQCASLGLGGNEDGR